MNADKPSSKRSSTTPWRSKTPERDDLSWIGLARATSNSAGSSMPCCKRMPTPEASSRSRQSSRPDRPGHTLCSLARTTRASAHHRRPGTWIGPYKLMQQIGEGGMGIVFMAEQEQPVRRKVALKIIKPGMDIREVIARFEAERQALALMDHPNIARVLDAGTTESGRPISSWSWSRGCPITEYCDDHQLAPRDRLEAVRHRLPGGPARPPEGRSSTATSSRRTSWWHALRRRAGRQGDRLRRRQGHRPAADRQDDVHPAPADRSARLEYMSPEQAEISAPGRRHPERRLLRSACCCTSCLPARRRSTAASLRERGLRRDPADRIKEEEPPKPSTRLSSLGEALPTISAQPEDRAGEAGGADAGRAGLDRDEVPGEGPDAAVRDGQRDGSRRRALPGRRGRRSLSAFGFVPAEEVRPKAPGRPGDGLGVRRPAGPGDRRERLAGGPGQAGRADRSRWNAIEPSSRNVSPWLLSGRRRPNGERPSQPGNRCGDRSTSRTSNWRRRPGTAATATGCATSWNSSGRDRAMTTCADSSGITFEDWARPSVWSNCPTV